MNSSIEITCRVCGASIPADSIDFDRRLATCSYCRTVFDLAGRGEKGSVEYRARAEVPLPFKFEVQNTERGMEVSWRWFGPRYLFMLLFCCVWMGFLAFWYIGGLSSGAPLVALLFPLVHVAVGVGLTYSTLAGLLNRTRLILTRGEFTIRHGPVPWRGNMTVKRADLDQLYCKEVVKSTKNGVSRSYEVHAVLKDGRGKKILDRLDDVEQALWLEQEMERRLKIEDRPVGGEIPR